FLNGRTFSCLVCPKSSPSCSEQQHPLQRLISYNELLAKYARKVNRDQYDAIGIYTCPYCALDRLTVDALYEHSRSEHSRLNATNEPPLPTAVHCPICVCFRLETFGTLVNQLPEHMLNRHCFASANQYQDEFKLRSDFCCDDEFELIRFLATFLPPAIISAETVPGYVTSSLNLDTKPNESQTCLVCPICLENIDEAEGKNLAICVHQFHGGCIDRWLEEKKCCPLPPISTATSSTATTTTTTTTETAATETASTAKTSSTITTTETTAATRTTSTTSAAEAPTTAATSTTSSRPTASTTRFAHPTSRSAGLISGHEACKW
uniref:RING-type domain-containing protein n=1 Tax=Anopheles dirus TaxID=7168 RepID=A0A182NQE7_9DIPT